MGTGDIWVKIENGAATETIEELFTADGRNEGEIKSNLYGQKSVHQFTQY